MKKLLNTKSSVMSFTVLCAVLITLCAVSLYYMQYDITAINWIYVVIYSILFISALSITSILKNQKEKHLLSIGLVVYNFINLIGSTIFALTSTNYFIIINAAAISFFAVFSLSYTDSLAVKKSFNSSIIYNIIVPCIFIIPSIISFTIKSQTNNMLAIIYFETVILFGISIILSVLNIIKQKHLFFSWTYFLFSLGVFLSNLLNILSTSNMQNLLHGYTCLVMAFLVPAILSEHTEIKVKRKK